MNTKQLLTLVLFIVGQFTFQFSEKDLNDNITIQKTETTSNHFMENRADPQMIVDKYCNYEITKSNVQQLGVESIVCIPCPDNGKCAGRIKDFEVWRDSGCTDLIGKVSGKLLGDGCEKCRRSAVELPGC